jgi:hypothetical protein
MTKNNDPVVRGRKAPPAAEVLEFMEQYGIAQRLKRPRERVLTWLARVSAGFPQLDDPPALADALLRQDLRSTLFYLEGILRLYRRRYEQALDAPYQRVKVLEDALGQLGAAVHLAELVRGLGLAEGALHWCERQVEVSRSELAAELAAGWMPLADGTIPLFASTCETLVGLDFEGYSRDRRSLIKELRRWLKTLADTPLDMYVLQGNHGMHELRRQLRWLPICAVSLDGLVITSDRYNPIEEYRALLTSEVARSPFARLPEPLREDRPIEISRSLFLACTQFISQLGELKDAAEDLQGLEHALLGSGVASSSRAARAQALSALGRTPEQQQDLHARAERLYRGLRRNRFFARLRSDFRR